MQCKVKEIFLSTQGEGLYVGYKQLFIRFCNCNLKCNYCDTPYTDDVDFYEFTPETLAKKVKEYDLKNIHSISLTGGEPLLWADFLQDFIFMVPQKFYLETNATLYKQYEKVKDLFEYVAADIKLPSATGIENPFKLHDNFFAIRHKNTFAKIVFDKNITDEEITECVNMAQKYELELILQPIMKGNDLGVSTSDILQIHDRFIHQYPKVRIIPQSHKFLGIE